MDDKCRTNAFIFVISIMRYNDIIFGVLWDGCVLYLLNKTMTNDISLYVKGCLSFDINFVL